MTFTSFYNQGHLAEISKRGYYIEKINFFLNCLQSMATKNRLRILDVACNDGYLSQIYSRFGQVTGVEMNKIAAAICKRKKINCLNKDIMDLPKKYHHQFDVVIAGDIIEHIFETDRFLKKLYSLLTPGGSLLLTTPNVASLARRIMLLFGLNPFLEFSTLLPYPEFNVGHVRYYTTKNLLTQLKLAGFTNVTIYGDKINLTRSLAIPYKIARFFPTVSRNLMVYCYKPKV